MKDQLSADRVQIEKAITDYAKYWNDHDMDSWGSLFTEDVDYINRGGGWWKNNHENLAGHKQIHKMMTENGQSMTFELEVHQILFLKTDVAIVHALSEWPGFKSPNPEEGIKNMKGIITCVFIKTEGKWLIRTLQNTLRN